MEVHAQQNDPDRGCNRNRLTRPVARPAYHEVMLETCRHISAIGEIKYAKRRECEECVRIGARWVHLRTCQTCGATLCCDSSPSHHASAHARAAHHPVISSAEPGERWLYCFVDDASAEY